MVALLAGVTPADGRPDMVGLSETHRQAVAQLEKRGWNAMVWRDGLSLLHWAAKTGRPEWCTYFLSLKADVNARDVTNRTPLDYADQQGHAEAAQRLRAHLRDIGAAQS